MIDKIKETARLYWMVKGHIPIWIHDYPEDGLDQIIDSYTRRLWGNDEAYIREDGFDQAWLEFSNKLTRGS